MPDMVGTVGTKGYATATDAWIEFLRLTLYEWLVHEDSEASAIATLSRLPERLARIVAHLRASIG